MSRDVREGIYITVYRVICNNVVVSLIWQPLFITVMRSPVLISNKAEHEGERRRRRRNRRRRKKRKTGRKEGKGGEMEKERERERRTEIILFP